MYRKLRKMYLEMFWKFENALHEESIFRTIYRMVGFWIFMNFLLLFYLTLLF